MNRFLFWGNFLAIILGNIFYTINIIAFIINGIMAIALFWETLVLIKSPVEKRIINKMEFLNEMMFLNFNFIILVKLIQCYGSYGMVASYINEMVFKMVIPICLIIRFLITKCKMTNNKLLFLIFVMIIVTMNMTMETCKYSAEVDKMVHNLSTCIVENFQIV